MGGRHCLDGEGRLWSSYSRRVHEIQALVDASQDYAYERAVLDGLSRAIFDVTGLWPHEHRGAPQVRYEPGL